MSAPADSDIPFINTTDPAFSFDSPEVAAAQTKSWYAKSPTGPIILRFPEVQELLRDRRLGNDGRALLALSGIFDGPIYDWFVPMIANQSGEDHRRLRSLVNRVFTPRMVNGLRPFIRAQAQRLTDGLASSQACEFVEDFANPLPLAVMARLLGLPTEDYAMFRAWTTDIGLVFSLAHGGDIADRVQTAVVGLSGYADSLIRAKEQAPDDDLLSEMVAAQREEGRVDRDELQNLVVTLVFAAHDTTRHQLSDAMVTFSEHPDQWTLLGRHPELAGQAVEEVFRWHPTAPAIFRTVAEDLDYQGLDLPKGTFITLCVHSAQRDPEVFDGGDRFDITATRPATSLQFGGGPHHCLGAALARAEIGEALPVLAGRLGPPAIAGHVTWRPTVGIHGPNELPLRFG